MKHKVRFNKKCRACGGQEFEIERSTVVEDEYWVGCVSCKKLVLTKWSTFEKFIERSSELWDKDRFTSDSKITSDDVKFLRWLLENKGVEV